MKWPVVAVLAIAAGLLVLVQARVKRWLSSEQGRPALWLGGTAALILATTQGQFSRSVGVGLASAWIALALAVEVRSRGASRRAPSISRESAKLGRAAAAGLESDFGPNTRLVERFCHMLESLNVSEWREVARRSRHTDGILKGAWRDAVTWSARVGIRQAGLDGERMRAGWAASDSIERRFGELVAHDQKAARLDPVGLSLEAEEVAAALVVSHRIGIGKTRIMYRAFERVRPLAALRQVQVPTPGAPPSLRKADVSERSGDSTSHTA